MKTNNFSVRFVFLLSAGLLIPTAGSLAAQPLANFVTQGSQVKSSCREIPFTLQYDSAVLQKAIVESFSSAANEMWGTMKPTVYRYAAWATFGFVILYGLNKYIDYRISLYKKTQIIKKKQEGKGVAR